MTRIVMVTSAHPVLDKRIFHRHAKLAHEVGYEVHLVAPSETPECEVEGIRIHGFEPGHSYLDRFRRLAVIFELAVRVNGDLYHLHDPDLLWLGRRLRRCLSVPVIYDAHEDFPLAARTSRGFLPGLGAAVGWVVDKVERRLSKDLDAVVCPHRARLEELAQGSNPTGIFLPNYPPRDVYEVVEPPDDRRRMVVYSGLLSAERGAGLILDAARRMPDVDFLLLAKFVRGAEQASYQEEVERLALPNLDFRGFVPYEEVPHHLVRASVGIMPWARTPQHLRAAQPSKLYEYMACYLPVVATDLPVTREVLSGTGSGLLHRAGDLDDFVRQVYAVLDDPERAAEMGRAGRRAFEERFSYERAGQELLAVYARLLGQDEGRSQR